MQSDAAVMNSCNADIFKEVKARKRSAPDAAVQRAAADEGHGEAARPAISRLNPADGRREARVVQGSHSGSFLFQALGFLLCLGPLDGQLHREQVHRCGGAFAQLSQEVAVGLEQRKRVSAHRSQHIIAGKIK